jgi:hypothetical protein
MNMPNRPDQIEVGQTYDVPCAVLRWKEDGRIYYVPVLEHPHSDPELGFPHHHYHIDGRFEIHPRIRHRLEIAGGYTRAVILTGGSNSYDFNGLVNQNLLCGDPLWLSRIVYGRGLKLTIPVRGRRRK